MSAHLCRLVRKRYHITQVTLAKILHVTSQAVYYWEAGRTRIPFLATVVLRQLARLSCQRSRRARGAAALALGRRRKTTQMLETLFAKTRGKS